MAGEEELRKIFREAAETLGKRVLHNRQLGWKPGARDQLSTNIRAAKMLVSQECNRSNAAWKAARPAAAKPVARGMTLGGHRAPPPRPVTQEATGTPASRPAWSAAKPSGPRRADAPVIGTRWAGASLFNDSTKAALKLGAVTGVIELLHEGAFSGADIFLDPDFSTPTAELGWQADGGPLVETTIAGIADMLRDSGLVETASLEAGTKLVGEIASCLPVIGAVITLSEAAAQGIKLALDIYRSRKLKKDAIHVTPGQPRAALEATRKLFDRHATEMGMRAGINGAAGAGAVCGLFLDFGAVTGPLTGIIKTVLNLVITIVYTCMTLSEMRAGNAIIRDGGPFDLSLIATSPMLGTYLLTEAESSVLYAFLVAGPLPRNWTDEVLKLKPTMENVIRSANVLQRRSSFLLEGWTEDGKKITSFAKGDHFLDTRLHKAPQRLMHEANLVIRRDPNAMGFLQRHGNHTTPFGLPGKK